MSCKQITLDDMLLSELASTKPRLSQGQTVYALHIDCVLEAEVGRSWLCRGDKPRYGYNINYKIGGCGSITDNDIGYHIFLDESEALKIASEVNFPKIEKENLEPFDGVGFTYVRECDGRVLESFVAKIGKNQLYEHDFICYHFIKIFKTEKEKDKAYNKIVKSVTDEANKHNGTDNPNPKLETLYKVSDTLYASRDYAERHSEYSDRRW